MEFLADNYIWIIVAVVVILMTIIGYIAEKTDFGRKEFAKREKKSNKTEGKSEKKEKEAKKNEEKAAVEAIEETAPMTLEATEEMSIPVEGVTEENIDVQFGEPLADDMEVASEELAFEEVSAEPIEEDLNAPLVEELPKHEEINAEEDLNAPFGDGTSFESEAFGNEFDEVEITNLESSVEEDLNVPFGDDVKETSGGINIDLPDIDSVKEDVASPEENGSDDDIWKF